MGKKLKYWWRIFTKILGIFFGLLGAVAILFPLADISANNIFIRVVILFTILAVAFIASLIGYLIYIKRKSNCVYSAGSTKIIFEYGDLNQIIQDKQQLDEKWIVVPVNTSLEYVFNREVVKDNTVHQACLDYLYSKMQKEVEISVLKKIKIKKGNIDFSKNKYGGKIGNWFLLLPEDLGIEDNGERFIFLEVFDSVEINGLKNNKELSREQYLSAMQSLMEAIPQLLIQEQKIYIPLIGAGAGNVGKPNDIMHFMKALLRFNKRELRQEIHVIILDKYRKEIPIYELTNF